MGDRSRKLVAVVIAALAATTACSGEGSGNGSSAGGRTSGVDSPGGSGNKKAIDSADEVIKIVDMGFVTYSVEKSVRQDYLSYGFVIENVSDEVALSVSVSARFTDEAGNPVPGTDEGASFTVVLPGQKMGAGGNNMYKGPVVADMEVKVTMIGSLDTPAGERHRNPPSPYKELRTTNPVATRTGQNDQREVVTLDVTNTYDVPLTPKATAVVRDAKGVIVGGMGNNAMDGKIQPGDSAQAKLSRDVHLPRLTSGTTEYYADPALGWIVTTDPVFEDR
jgi:hypothetical protein